jgi:peptidoglycan L-alanyl-D-glutamate endopeptidase CwlK
MYKFGTKSKERLATVHPDLQKLFNAAISTSPYDFSITEGVRSLERQKELLEAGKSTTMNSRHLKGNAVDIAVFVEGKLTWDFKYYKEVSDHIKALSKSMQIPIVWGGDWKSFIDGVHYELDRKFYA